MIETKTFTSPIAVFLPRKTKPAKRIALNLNTYRNLNFIVNNIIKAQYCAEMAPQLKDIKLKTPITLSFTLHRKDRREGDRANVLSIVEKFFCDSLVHFGCIEDDSDVYVESSHYYTGEIDKERPRVDVEILESNK